MYYLQCLCGREVIVPKIELPEGQKSQIKICECFRKIEIQWPGEVEKRDANA